MNTHTAPRRFPLLAAVLLLLGAAADPFASVAHAAAPRVARRIDGVYVSRGRENPRVIAVMIDGHLSARPPAGLNHASVVYEALAEGGIPRYMAVYARTGMPLVGPVRSARPYFVRFAAEYPAAIAHVGGSPDAQELIKKLKIRNIEGQKGPTGKFFFRKGSGVHSAFTNGALLREAMRNKKGKKAILHYDPWQFQDDAKMADRPKRRAGVNLNINGNRAYDIRFEYSRKRNVYLRKTGGLPLKDRATNRQIYAKNVILQFVPKEKVLDRKGRIELKTIGSGKGILLQNGKAQTIRWRKPSSKARTTFTTLDRKNPIKLVRGSTWITVVPKGRSYRLF